MFFDLDGVLFSTHISGLLKTALCLSPRNQTQKGHTVFYIQLAKVAYSLVQILEAGRVTSSSFGKDAVERYSKGKRLENCGHFCKVTH